MKASDLSKEQQTYFIEFFYDNWPEEYQSDLTFENPAPWGMPWHWCPDSELIGESIREMADNFWSLHEKDIMEILEKEKENEHTQL